MANLKVYGTARSRALRVLWAAEEAGVPYDHVALEMKGGAHRTAELLSANPMGRLPAIDDGGFKLAESMAINLYIAKKYGKGLYPATLEEEARTWAWTLFAVNEIDPPLGEWAYNTIVLPEAERVPEKARLALEKLQAPFAVLDRHFAKQSHLVVPDRFTIGDLNLAAAMLRALSLDLAKYPALAAWLKRCWDRPAARKVRAMRGD